MTRWSVSPSIARSRGSAGLRRQGAERRRQRRPHAPVRIGIQPGQHRHEPFADRAARAPKRGRANQRAADRPSDIEQRIDRRPRRRSRRAPSRLRAAAADRASALRMIFISARRGRGIAERGRARGPLRWPRGDPRPSTSGDQHAGPPTRSFSRAEALGRKRARVGVRVLQRAPAAPAAPADPRAAAARTPPATSARAAAAPSSDGGGERLVRLQPHEREQRQPERAPPACRVARRHRRPADWPAHPTATICDAICANRRRRAAGSPIRPSASAALPLTSGDGSASAATSGSRARRDRRSGRARTPPSAALRDRHPPSSAHQRRHAFGQADAADRQRRAAADARLAHRSSSRTRSGGGGGGGGGGGATGALRSREPEPAAAAAAPAHRRGIAQHALILEPEDPRHLLFEAWTVTTGGCRRRAGGALAHADASQLRSASGEQLVRVTSR